MGSWNDVGERVRSIDQGQEAFGHRWAVRDGSADAVRPGGAGGSGDLPDGPVDPTVDDLVIRAQLLRDWAGAWPGPLAAASRRRAAELELVATVLEPLTDDTGPRPGARVRLRGQQAG